MPPSAQNTDASRNLGGVFNWAVRKFVCPLGVIIACHRAVECLVLVNNNIVSFAFFHKMHRSHNSDPNCRANLSPTPDPNTGMYVGCVYNKSALALGSGGVANQSVFVSF